MKQKMGKCLSLETADNKNSTAAIGLMLNIFTGVQTVQVWGSWSLMEEEEDSGSSWLNECCFGADRLGQSQVDDNWTNRTNCWR